LNIKVQRQTLSPFSTIGELFIDGEHECWTMEPVFSTEDVKPRAIPEGTYSLIRRFSAEHKRDVPGVENVPGFTDIEIHWGNFPVDTKACMLVGQTKGPHPDFIGSSKIAFGNLWDKLVPVWDRGETIDITYVNAPIPKSAGSPTEVR
jgi:hypothetical protein